MFSRKSVFEVKKSDNKEIDELELELIDFGMSELETNEFTNDKGETSETLVIYGDYESFGSLNEGIEKLGLEIVSGALKFVPNTKQNFSDEQLNEIEILLDRLDDDDDVVAVFTNIE